MRAGVGDSARAIGPAFSGRLSLDRKKSYGVAIGRGRIVVEPNGLDDGWGGFVASPPSKDAAVRLTTARAGIAGRDLE
jgi:hypothetical protein